VPNNIGARSAPVDLLSLPTLMQPSIEKTIYDADTRGDIPQTLRAELRDRGAFRLLTPRELGGSETPLPDILKIYEGFGRIDASVGLLVWNANWGFIAAFLNEAGVEHIWGSGHEPILSNSGSPGTAVPVDGGYRLSGHWKIVSGVRAADWLIAVSVVIDNGAPRLNSSGAPDLRLFAIHRDQLRIEHTWDVSGMRATGSDSATADDAFIAAELVTPPIDDPPRIDRPLYRGHMPSLVFPGCAAVILGVAQSAIEETVKLASEKKAPGGGTISESARAQYLIAKSDAAIAAARLLLHSAAGSLQATTERRGTVTLEQRAQLRAAMSHAAQAGRESLLTMYELGGSASLYRTNPLERYFRDGMAALQHANLSAKFLEAAGRVRLGMPPGVPLF
jgi:alkylation response protein AidB-like acyl-CoA dehydrogenase